MPDIFCSVETIRLASAADAMTLRPIEPAKNKNSEKTAN
jgi:hypothetical protein